MSEYIWKTIPVDNEWQNSANWDKTGGGTGYPGAGAGDIAKILSSASISFNNMLLNKVIIQIDTSDEVNFTINETNTHIQTIECINGIFTMNGIDLIELNSIKSYNNSTITINNWFGNVCNLIEINDTSIITLNQ